MDNSSPELDVEAELFKILQEEIWKEITAECGLTQAMLDEQLIAKLREVSRDAETKGTKE